MEVLSEAMHECGTWDLDAGFADHLLQETAFQATQELRVLRCLCSTDQCQLVSACKSLVQEASLFIHIHFLQNTYTFSFSFLRVTQKPCVAIIFLLDLEEEWSLTPSNAMEGRKIFEGFLYIRDRMWFPRSYFSFRPLWKPHFFTLSLLAYRPQKNSSRATLRAHLSPRFSSLIGQQGNLM